MTYSPSILKNGWGVCQASVLFVLGLTSRLADLVDFTADELGRSLEEERLPKRVRLPGRKREKNDV
ncbi:hypothetical protein SCG7109_AH_00020 [Chlamydiales bacterium SCGC AG-110-M15]|nr:hypothetical protein SCG7109_AH_00020 [Chlamydiales bacterium SCGC AG-110-M15]